MSNQTSTPPSFSVDEFLHAILSSPCVSHLLALWFFLCDSTHTVWLEAYALAKQDSRWLILYALVFMFVACVRDSFMSRGDNPIVAFQEQFQKCLCALKTNLDTNLTDLVKHCGDIQKGLMSGIGTLFMIGNGFVYCVCAVIGALFCGILIFVLLPFMPIIWLTNLTYSIFWAARTIPDFVLTSSNHLRQAVLKKKQQAGNENAGASATGTYNQNTDADQTAGANAGPDQSTSGSATGFTTDNVNALVQLMLTQAQIINRLQRGRAVPAHHEDEEEDEEE